MRARVREISLKPRSTLLGRVTIHVGEEGASTRDEKLMTQTGGPRVLGVCPDLANEGASDEEAVGDTIRALVNHRVPFMIATDGLEMMRTQLRDEFELLLRIGEVEEGLLGRRVGACTRRASCSDLMLRKG